MIKKLRRIWGILTPSEHREALAVLGVMLLAAAFQAVGVGAIHPFLEILEDPSQARNLPAIPWIAASLGWTTNEGFIVLTGTAVFLLIVLGNAFLTLSSWVQLRFLWQVTHSLSSRLFRSYIERDYEFYLTRNTSNLTRNVIDETNRINVHLVNPVLRVISNGGIALAILVVLLFVNFRVTLFVALFVGGLFAAAYYLIRRRIGKLGEEYSRHNEERFRVLQHAFGGIKDLKLSGRSTEYADKFESTSESFVKTLAFKKILEQSPKYVIEAIAFGGLLLVVLGLVVSGQSVSSIVPLIGLFAFAGYRIMPAFRGLLGAFSSFEFFDDLLTDFEEELSELEASSDTDQIDPMTIAESISLQEVSFTYPGANKSALDGVTIRIEKGDTVAIAGPTGAGKTTLIDIILGLLSPTAGTLEIDGESLEESRLRAYQQSIGYVPQEIFLADDTIRQNIALGVPSSSIDDSSVRNAAKVAQIQDFIEQDLPEGYDTYVGENGIRLSGGQKQRIGIARALYSDPEVLVFDEATSEVDGVTQARITEAIEALQGQKTLIIVAHRLSTIRQADEIYLLRNHRIVDSGTFTELECRNAQFRAMAQGDK